MTAQEALNAALVLADEVEDNNGTGQFRADAARDFKAPYIIDRLQREIARAEGIEPSNITSLTDELVISDGSAGRVLPYGVAAELMLADRMMNEAQSFQYMYNERFRSIGVKSEDLIDDMNVMRGF